jgi:YjbE family integral membrane protein
MIDAIVQWFSLNWLGLANVIMIDVVLAGDNAIVVGLAASQVAPSMRTRVIFWGILGAVILRILFAGVATQLLQIVGLMLAGGLLLLWVCWKMYRQISAGAHEGSPHSVGAAATSGSKPSPEDVGNVSFWTALGQIIVADVSMSLDNVLAVAGAAKGETLVLVIGLAVAIVLMAIASQLIARLLERYPAITWLGLAIILYVALDMIYVGSREVACAAYASGCRLDLWQWVRANVWPFRP